MCRRIVQSLFLSCHSLLFDLPAFAQSFKEINENLKVLNEDLAVTNGIASQYDELGSVWSTFVKEVIPASIPDDKEAN